MKTPPCMGKLGCPPYMLTGLHWYNAGYHCLSSAHCWTDIVHLILSGLRLVPTLRGKHSEASTESTHITPDTEVKTLSLTSEIHKLCPWYWGPQIVPEDHVLQLTLIATHSDPDTEVHIFLPLYWGPHTLALTLWSTNCSTTGPSKAVVCAVLSGGKYIKQILRCLLERVAYMATAGFL